MTDAFIDTNILLYAASTNPQEAAKAAIAEEIVRTVRFGISVQVLQEFYVNATGKLAVSIPEERVRTVLSLLRRRPIVSLTPELFDAAVKLKAQFQISYWDAAIVAAAKGLRVKTIYSEDLAHWQSYDGVQVVNPFVAHPAT